MTTEQARRAAKHIVEDRDGADYYQNINLLADYLAGTLGIEKEQAEKLAKDIDEDRRGANYYQDVEILAEYLSG